MTGVIVNWFYFYLWIQSTGYSIHIRKGFYVIKPDLAMKVARFWHLFVMLWICQFILGFQHIILGSSVAVWYFTRLTFIFCNDDGNLLFIFIVVFRNKRNLGNPILYSFYNLIMYHLGSVCLGSLLTLTFNFPQALLETIQKYLKSRKCSKYSSHMYCFERFLKYTSRNAYIEIGKTFQV